MVGLGAVGVATASAILAQGLATRLTFFDSQDAKAEGEAWDFAHAAALLPACVVEALPSEQLFGGEVCVLSAGVKSRPGESRLALLERNAAVAHTLCDRFEANGFPRILLVLTNPVDVLTEILTRRLAGKGVAVFGSGTSLDTFRLRQMIAAKARIHPTNVHAWVVGEHGDSSVSLFSSANVGCVPLLNYPTGRPLFTQGDCMAMEKAVRCAAGKIIERKGATAHAIGLTAARLVRAIVKNENILMPVSVRVSKDTCASLPCLIDAKGPGEALKVPMSPSEAAAFEASLGVVRAALETVQ